MNDRDKRLVRWAVDGAIDRLKERRQLKEHLDNIETLFECRYLLRMEVEDAVSQMEKAYDETAARLEAADL